MRVIVTGGCGFIGSHVVDLLATHDNQVHVIDDLSTGNEVRSITTKALFSKFDIGFSPVLVDRIFEAFKPEVVLHLAAQAAITVSETKPDKDLMTNGVGTINVLQAAKAVGVRRFVFASTSAVYADTAKRHLSETSKSEPASAYGISKLAAEQYVHWAFPNNSVILRLGNVYGPRQVPIGENQLIARMLNHLKNHEPFYIHGDGKQERDFVYVEDVARAFLAGINGKPGTYNISSGKPTSVNEAAEIMAEMWGFPGYEWKHDPNRQDPRRRVWLDVNLAAADLRWQAKQSLAIGIDETIKWWKDASSANPAGQAPFSAQRDEGRRESE